MSKLRTEVENLFLTEMFEEDSQFILSESPEDIITPENNRGLFDDVSSSNDMIDDVDSFDDDEVDIDEGLF